jgi:hypothetical protein
MIALGGMNPKIDLTEKGDFRETSYITSLVDLPTDGRSMTLDQHLALRRFESIFGKRRHDDNRFIIFGITRFIKDRECHCDRCGKELRIPWKRPNSGLCQECEDILDREYGSNHPPFSPVSRDSSLDIFNLK